MDRFGKWEQKCILGANTFSCFYLAGSHAAQIHFARTVEKKMALNSQSSGSTLQALGLSDMSPQT